MGNAHPENLVKPEPKHLAGLEVEVRIAQFADQEIERRPVSQDAVKGFGEKSPVEKIKLICIQGFVEHLIREGGAGLPVLQRLNASGS